MTARRRLVPEDAWAEMDAWCEEKAERCLDEWTKLWKAGTPSEDPRLSLLHGQSHAFHQMRSYIHGARKVRDGS